MVKTTTHEVSLTNPETGVTVTVHVTTTLPYGFSLDQSIVRSSIYSTIDCIQEDAITEEPREVTNVTPYDLGL